MYALRSRDRSAILAGGSTWYRQRQIQVCEDSERLQASERIQQRQDE
ncbi:MAG: hypothetical protein ACFCU8_10975 [Thermosynechococcaceae cyanobacterium]